MKTLALSLSAALLLAAPASAQMIVVGEGHAASCYQSARDGNPGTQNALDVCDRALETGRTTKRDRAATHVNRGVLLMRSGALEASEADYRAALRIRDDLPEAHINLGVALYQMNRDAEALAAYDTAVAMEDDKLLPMALFNRGLLHERRDDVRAAYRDFKRAAELDPDWALPRDALTRFTVTKRNS